MRRNASMIPDRPGRYAGGGGGGPHPRRHSMPPNAHSVPSWRRSVAAARRVGGGCR